jgi:hypothetical protein
MKSSVSPWAKTVSATMALALLPLSAWAQDLLEPIGGANANDLFSYFNPLAQWAQGVAAGLAVAWVLWSGAMIIMAGSDTGQVETAKKHMFAAIIGLLVLFFSGQILHMINPLFFKV